MSSSTVDSSVVRQPVSWTAFSVRRHSRMRSSLSQKLCWWVTTLVGALLLGVSASADATKDTITVLGLGSMGGAVASCLAKNYTVHGWNRSPKEYDGITMYASPNEAVQHSKQVLIFIDAWDGTVERLEELSLDLQDRTVVVFSTYTPDDIKKVDSSGYTLVGGAVVGVPQTICTPQALILTTKEVSILESVGRVVALGEDVGLASLVNMALIWVITFGLIGLELSHLVLSRYGVDSSVVSQFTELSIDVGSEYGKLLMPSVSKAFASGSFGKSYVPVGVFRRVLRKQLSFLETLGLEEDDTFLDSYVRSLERVPDEQDGPVAWTQHLDQHSGAKGFQTEL